MMVKVNGMGFYSHLLMQHQYAFVDRATTYKDAYELYPIIPLVPDSLRSDANKMPALIPLMPDAPYMERLAACMTLGQEMPYLDPVATLIAVPPDVSQDLLVRHFISRLICDSPQGKMYLRYFSSDIFPHLVRVLSAERLKSLFGKVDQWTYHFQNEWITVPAPDVTEGVPVIWRVLQGQREAIDLLGMVNRVLGDHKEQMGRPWKNHAEWNEKARIAEASFGIAQRVYHLSDSADLTTFARQAMAHGERFYHHPRIHDLLQHTASRPGAYSDASRSITNGEWVKIATELPLHTKFRGE